MEGTDPGIKDAIARLTRLRKELRCEDVVVHWQNKPPLGTIALIVDHDGWQLFHDGEPVPRRES